jgi:hypothetical protein
MVVEGTMKGATDVGKSKGQTEKERGGAEAGTVGALLLGQERGLHLRLLLLRKFRQPSSYLHITTASSPKSHHTLIFITLRH